MLYLNILLKIHDNLHEAKEALKQNEEEGAQIFTLISGDDGKLFIEKGFHLVNRQGYVVIPNLIGENNDEDETNENIEGISTEVISTEVIETDEPKPIEWNEIDKELKKIEE